jgi:hypothetical protein
MISSAYKLCAQIIEKRLPADEWNIYPFHFSDGDNWSVDDTLSCIEHLEEAPPAQGRTCSLRPGREPLRLGPVHQGPARAPRQGRARGDERDPRQGRDRQSIKDFLGKGKWPRRVSKFALSSSRCCPVYLREWQSASRRSRGATGSTSSRRLRDPHLRPDERDRGLRGLPQPLSALALRHGVRAALEELRVRPLEDLRDGHQQQPLVRLPARGQLAHRSEARDGARLRPRRLLQEQLLLPRDRPRRARPLVDPAKRPEATTPTGAGSTRWPTTARA